MKNTIVSIVEAPDISLSWGENAGDVLIKFYKALGWNGEDTIEPCKVRTTKDVFNQLYDLMFDKCPDSLGLSMFMVNKGPGTDDYVPPGKVCLLEGWATPVEKKGSA